MEDDANDGVDFWRDNVFSIADDHFRASLNAIVAPSEQTERGADRGSGMMLGDEEAAGNGEGRSELAKSLVQGQGDLSEHDFLDALDEALFGLGKRRDRGESRGGGWEDEDKKYDEEDGEDFEDYEASAGIQEEFDGSRRTRSRRDGRRRLKRAHQIDQSETQNDETIVRVLIVHSWQRWVCANNYRGCQDDTFARERRVERERRIVAVDEEAQRKRSQEKI